jgi:DNA-binding IclR family transcriptional regulator
MPCVRADGEPTRPGIDMLRALAAGAQTAEEVASESGLPLFRVRGGLRELAEAGFIRPVEYFNYVLTPRGAERVQQGLTPPPQRPLPL